LFVMTGAWTANRELGYCQTHFKATWSTDGYLGSFQWLPAKPSLHHTIHILLAVIGS